MAEEEVTEPVEDTPVEEAESEEVHIPVPAEITEEVEIPEEEEPVLEASYHNRAWLFREYVLNKRSMNDIAEQFGVDPMLVKKNLVDWDMFENFRSAAI